jgi:hypothetical protein
MKLLTSRVFDHASRIARGLTVCMLPPLLSDPAESSCDICHSLFFSRETMFVDGGQGK